jgi:hypothetical protein
MARSTPSLAQAVATLRGDGTCALGSAPTVGNLMVMAVSGFAGSIANYFPTGMQLLASYLGDANNAVRFYARVVQSGDTGSYALTATDTHTAVLYEFAGAACALPIWGGLMTGYFSGTSFTIGIPKSPFGVNDWVLGAFEHDPATVWSLTGETGLTVDYTTTSASNHTGIFFHTSAGHDGILQGSIASGSPTGAVYGYLAIAGKP